MKKVAVAMSGPEKSLVQTRDLETRKVAVALSGGVDSGVAAALMVKAGYETAGFHFRLWKEKLAKVDESLEAARETAQQLNIPFHLVDFRQIFKKRVVDYFLEEYAKGLTPNPCVKCNQLIKFGRLMKYAKKLGYDFLATGHYARIVEARSVTNFSLMKDARDTLLAHESNNLKDSPEGGSSALIRSQGSLRVSAQNGRLHLLMGRDKKKDQSYFLYNLTQRQLAHVLFPVGDYFKEEVVEMAKKWKLPVAERPESQEICFFKESDYRPFLKRQIHEKIIPGEVVDAKGRIIGKHFGLPLYTIGQRHGFKVNSKLKNQKSKIIPPYYVIDKKVKKNQLVVGFGKEAERKEFWVKDVNWLVPQSLGEVGIKCQVRIRHQGELLKSRLKGLNSKVLVDLNEPERGVAPGQAAVFYQDEEMLGGGIIGIDPAKSRFR